jgi:DNA/RNA-binding domain of Phe-tRNA-synthetase-like protein
MLVIAATERWQDQFPGGCVGILEMAGLDNSRPSGALEERKRQVEQDLRSRYAGFTRADFLGLEAMAAYERYYRQFDKTYHVLLQLESVVLKGKPLPEVSPLVDASFMAELETLVLTASHDADRLSLPLKIDATDGSEPFTQMNGASRTLRAGDMCMVDGGGVICTILYGQDSRSPIRAETTHALYVSYAPAGVGQALVRLHLEKMRDLLQTLTPEAEVCQLELFTAGP